MRKAFQYSKPRFIKALASLFFLILFVVGVTFMAFLYYQYVRERQKRDPQYTIRFIEQKKATKDGFTTYDLAELFSLSCDVPTNLYLFDLKEAQKKLENHPIVKKGVVTLKPPDALSVEYTLKSPIALVGLQENRVVDEMGNQFPLLPFFKNYSLPVFYFDEDPTLAITLLKTAPFSVASIDTLKAEALSFGQRQVVMTLVNGDILRLDQENYQDAFSRYQLLPKKETPQLVDLRIPKLAFLSELDAVSVPE